MERLITFDKQGRIYIPEEIRSYLRFKTMAVKILNKGIFLEPIKDDPIQALGELGKGKLKKPIKELKKEARQKIEKDAIKKLRRQ